MKARVCYFLLLIFLVGCGGSSSDSTFLADDLETTTPVNSGSWYKPATAVTWQLQLNGFINIGYAVELYDIDLFDTPQQTIVDLHAASQKVICYFSGGSYEDWRSDANQFATSDVGNNLDGWPGEYWLDIRSTAVREIMLARLDLAVSKGCDGVDVDNMDGYTNSSGFALTANDQLDYNRFIANAAHQRGLAIGLKNDLDQIEDLVNYFDFSVNEECFEYDECDLLIPFIQQGKPVLQVEYKQEYVNDPTARSNLCAQSLDFEFSTLIMPLELDDSFRFSCH